ncbi:MAG: efflux RND transporter periplasmic adaptor subunit, partial [Planctomycetota bacterium]
AREWELLGDSVEVTEDGQRLALREPYVAQRRAEVSGAEAQLNRAKLDLERTVVAAPFDAVVLSEDVELGTQAVVGAELARLVDRTEFVVEVSVPMARLPLIRLDGAPATVVLETGVHEGRVERLLGEVDAAGRMARVQVAIPDPLGDDGAPVLLGAYVRVDLPSRPIPGAVSVPRAALREGDVVWTLDDEDRLEIVPVDVALRRPEDVLVSGGLDGGERIVVSPISVPLPGMLLAPRSRDDEGGAAQPASFDVPASFEDPAAFKVKGSGE